jgi:uncharacterized protein YndB with AHSA1/START domain
VAPGEAETDFVISRTFDAPRDLVWKARTEAERLAKWWRPGGATIRVIKFDFTPGGIFHYAMSFQPGHDMYGRFVHREIEAPSRLVFVSSFSDAEGGVTRAPFPQLGATWPLEVLNEMTLTEQDGRTTLTIRGRPIDATDEEHKTFRANVESMRQAFGDTLDKLAEYLASA